MGIFESIVHVIQTTDDRKIINLNQIINENMDNTEGKIYLIRGRLSETEFDEQKKLMKIWQKSSGGSFNFTDNYDEADVIVIINNPINTIGATIGANVIYDKETVYKAKWDFKPIIVMPRCGTIEELESNAVSLDIKYGPKYLEYAVKTWTSLHKNFLAKAEYGRYNYSEEIYDKIENTEN